MKLLAHRYCLAVVLSAFASIAGGCLSPDTITCDDGTVCPSSKQCIGAGACASPEDVLACTDLGPGDSCNSGFGPGICRNGACAPARCGDGIVDEVLGEVCDDGNLDSSDGCRGDCRSTEVCGNGVVDLLTGESCDDGNALSHDGCASSCLVEAPRWRRIPMLGRMAHPIMVYDTRRDRVVLYGNNGTAGASNYTWEFDGTMWQLHVTEHSPGRPGPATYDGVNNRVVMVTELGKTWSYDGIDWTEIAGSSDLPSRLRAPAIAFDEHRQKVVLIGFSDSSVLSTWELAADSWSLRSTPAFGDNGEGNYVLVYDPTREALLFFTPYDVAWSFNGTWSPTMPSLPPPPAYYDSQYFTNYARNCVTAVNSSGTYDLQGNAWVTHTFASPTPLYYDYSYSSYVSWSDQTLAYTGTEYSGRKYETYLLNSADNEWRLAAERHAAASPLDSIVTDLSTNSVMVYANGDDEEYSTTQRFNGSRWNSVSSPNQYDTLSFVFDAQAASVLAVRYGGRVYQRQPDGAWNTPLIAGNPLELDYLPAIAYDRANSRTVAISTLGVLWGLVDNNWVALNNPDTALAPSPRRNADIVYNEATDSVLLFGGYASATGEYFSDTWIFSNNAWTQIETPENGTPPARNGHNLTYDVARGTVLLLGGYGPGGSYEDIWEFNGSKWSELLTSVRLPANSPVSYDGVARATMLPSDSNNDTWYLSYSNPDAPEEVCDNAVTDADGDGFAGCDDPDCWARCRPFCSPHVICDENRPHCGDGVCNAALETAALCPSDC